MGRPNLLTTGFGVYVLGSLFAGMILQSAAAAEPSLPELDLDAVTEWMSDNLDPRLLAALGDIDKQRIEALYKDLLRRLQGTNVYELADLTGAARQGLKVLKQFEEARPYATWLETHLDYFTAADELQRSAPSTPRANPSVESQNKVWADQLLKRNRPARADVWVEQLKPVFSTAGVPPQLVWLGEVESSFEPTARSPAGAVGMFQLMPATARSLGLELRPNDERLDPHKSAQAAAKYLRYLYGRFGDWRLALAAYNAGEARVKSLLDRTKARSYAAIASYLPAETQMYVPKVEATIRKREGVILASLR